jgi:membrane-associated protein
MIMIELAIQWKDFLNPEFYIQHGGLWLFLFIVFAETGLFAGFFLPGDSLLFVAGIYSNELAAELFQFDNDLINLVLIALLVILSGVLGNMVGYWFGAASGPFLFSRKDTFFFKKKHLFAAKEFYDKHGGGAIVFARFLPIIRTFAPIIAGIVRMERHKFTLYNIIGSICWAISMLFAGHYLYKFFLKQFGFDLKDRLELIVLGIILVTTAPVIIRLLRKPKK